MTAPEKDFCSFGWPAGAANPHVCFRPIGHAGAHECICTAIEEEERLKIKNQQHHVFAGSESVKEHNQKLLYTFEKSADNAKVAVLIGGTSNGHIHVGVDMALPPEAIIDLLHIAIEGLLENLGSQAPGTPAEPGGQPS
jgi:hypothetical protein